MARILLFVVLIVIVRAEEEDTPIVREVPCSSDNERNRNEIIEKSKCGAPKDVFIYLKPQAAHEQVSPGGVWVKRCVGDCDYDTYGSHCVATKKQMNDIPVRISNTKTFKERCSMYPVEEHVTCGCCKGPASACAPPLHFTNAEFN